MANEQNLTEKIEEEQEYIKQIQIRLFENLQILLENQKSKVDQQDVVVQNQGLIIRNQEVIVNNQIQIMHNQHTIMENQATLKAILKVQERLLLLMEHSSGTQLTEEEVSIYIRNLESGFRQRQTGRE
jgi:hypothetical protein